MFIEKMQIESWCHGHENYNNQVIFNMHKN
jgi:hypothetical protein